MTTSDDVNTPCTEIPRFTASSGQHCIDEVWRDLKLLGQLPALDKLVACSSVYVRHPPIIPYPHSSIMVSHLLGEGASAEVYLAEDVDTHDVMAIKTFFHVDPSRLEDIGEEVALLLQLQAVIDRIPSTFRLSAWAKVTREGVVTSTVVPLQPPIAKLLSLSIDRFVYEECLLTDGSVDMAMIRASQSECANLDEHGADVHPSFAAGSCASADPRQFWAVDGMYIELYESSAQDLVDGMRENGTIDILDGMRLTHGVLHALAWLEKLGTVHADVKLENFLVKTDLRNRLTYPSFTTAERPYTSIQPPLVMNDFGLSFPPSELPRLHCQDRPVVSPAFRSPELAAAELEFQAMAARGEKPQPSSLEISSKIDVYAGGIAIGAMVAPRPDDWPYVPTDEALPHRIIRGTLHATGMREEQNVHDCHLTSMSQYLTTADPGRRPSAYAASMLETDMLADRVIHTALRREDAKARGIRLNRNAWDSECGLMAKAMLSTLGRAALTNTGLGDASDRCVADAGRARQEDTPAHEACGLLFVGGAWPSHAYREDPTLRPAHLESAEKLHLQTSEEPRAGPVCGELCCKDKHDSVWEAQRGPRATFGGYIGHPDDEILEDPAVRTRSCSAPGCLPSCGGAAAAVHEQSCAVCVPAAICGVSGGSSGRLIGSTPGEMLGSCNTAEVAADDVKLAELALNASFSSGIAVTAASCSSASKISDTHSRAVEKASILQRISKAMSGNMQYAKQVLVKDIPLDELQSDQAAQLVSKRRGWRAFVRNISEVIICCQAAKVQD